jgi:trans-aconitate 2-methyltransferase
VPSPSWDPAQYERFAAERGRPFHDLIARVEVDKPAMVVDLGCGPGSMTATLTERWPNATVLGIDSSPDMIAVARGRATERLRFELADLVDWTPEPKSVDVIVSNATLQWVPEHITLLPGWLAALRPGGALAFSVPAPGSAGAGPIFRAVATSPRWADKLADVASAHGPQGASPVRDPADYVAALAGPGRAVDVWETTYLHLLPGADPVLEWFTGTGLRPYLDRLNETEKGAFRAEVAHGLRESYPERPYGTVLPFRRIFAVVNVP